MPLEKPVNMPSFDARKRQKTAKLKKKLQPAKRFHIYIKKAENSFATQNFP